MSSVGAELTMHGIREDATFVGRYLSALRRSENRSFAPQLSFCMGSYLALFIYEGLRKLRSIDDTLAQELSSGAEQMIARSRHSLKFFEDTKRGLDGVRSAFGDEIIPAHRDYFVGLLRFKWLEPFAKDIGIYRYHDRVISTTHSATFALGLEARAISQDDAGAQVRQFSEEYGQYFGRLGARIDTHPTSFPDTLDPSAFSQKVEDLRSAKFYPDTFNGDSTPDLNAALVLLLGHLNFITDVVAPEGSEAPQSYTTFKIRFLTIYQVVRSLSILRDVQAETLRPDSRAVIDTILQHPASISILRDDVRPLRNTLMHYGLDSRLDPSAVDTSAFIRSLIVATLDENQADQFFADVDSCISVAARSMNDWFGGPTLRRGR